MKISALQFSLGVSVLTHALALSVVSVALHGRSAKAPALAPAEVPVLGITLLSEQTVAAAETETPSAPSQPQAAPPTPAPVAPANPPPPQASHLSQRPHTPVPPPPSEPNPQPVACPEEPLPASWAFSETPPFPISDLPASASAAPAGEEQSSSRPSVTASGAGSAPSLGGPFTGAHANYLANPKPVYPEQARRRKQEGLVLLGVTLTAAGLPSRVEVSQSSGFALLDEAALGAVKRWRFSPARRDSAAVASQVEVPIHFKLTN